MNIELHMRNAQAQIRQEGWVATLASLLMNQHEFGWIEGAMRRAEARHKIRQALEYAYQAGLKEGGRK